MAFILHNDVYAAADQAVLTVANRGFRYGDGLFESMRMLNGKLSFPDFHADRIRQGMQALKLEGHSLFDGYFLKQKAAELMKRNKLNGNARFRLTIFREGDGFYTPAQNKAGYVLESIAMPSARYELNQRGLIVDVFDEIPKPVNKFSNFKTTNALIYVMAGIFQKQYRLDEAILLNQQGFLCESTSSNIFIRYQDELYTPALTEGCVGGVMRKVIMQLAKMNTIPLTEAQINPEILKEADEVFVTNAASGIRWVMGYGKKRYFNEMAKILNVKLNEFA